MKNKLNTGYMLLGAIALLVIVVVVSNADVSGSLTYARLKGTGCSETDWGRDYTTKGEITDDHGINVKDWCETSKLLIEYSCSADGEIVREAYKCSSGYSCIDGACTSDPTSCSDPDGGVRSFTKGTTSKVGESGTDYCYSDITVNEYYCTPIGEIRETLVNCAYGCSNGACVSG